MPPNSQPKQLRLQLKSILRTFANIQDFLETFDSTNGDTQELLIRQETLEEKYERAQPILLNLAACGKDEDFSLQDEIEERYCMVKSSIRKLIPNNLPISTTHTNTEVNIETTTKQTDVKLPRVQLQKFDGTPENWLPFFQLFSALVHNRTDLPKVIKFQHLKGSLDPEPLKLINQIPLIEQNYELAINLLEKRFNNPRSNALRYIRSLRELPKVMVESVSSIKAILDKFSTTVKILENMGHSCNDGISNLLICDMILEKLDKKTHELYEVHATEYTIAELQEFLEKRVEILDSMNRETGKPNKSISSGTPKPFTKPITYIKPTTSAKTFIAADSNCVFCKNKHYHFQCESFLKLTPIERQNQAKQHQLCFNCLKPNHTPQTCKSFKVCRTCNKRHHTLLHLGTPATSNTNQNSTNQQLKPTTSSECTTKPESTVTLASTAAKQVILPTVTVIASNNYGETCEARAIIDSCSTSHYITTAFSKLLSLEWRSHENQITGIGGSQSIARYSTEFTIASNYTNFSAKIEATILDEITSVLPCHPINEDATGWILKQDLTLSDKQFMTPGKIDLLIGADLFFKLLLNSKIAIPNSNLELIETHFGWVVAGTDTRPPKRTTNVCFVSVNLQKFWEMEEIPTKPKLSQEELFCEEHYVKNTEKTPDGRFIVKLPFKVNPDQLGNTKPIALNRLNSMQQKMQRNEIFGEAYSNFMQDYENLGHMTLTSQSSGYYLPHHAVLKLDSSTTKLRIVFDGTASPNSGLSLNEALAVGPTVQSTLFEIILRFRKHIIALVADIAQMYRQILVHPDDRQYQLILWNKNSSTVTYQLNTVTYGTASAPFLATRTLKQIAIETAQSNPIVSNIIDKDTYVDDVVTGTDNIDDAINVQMNLRQTLKASGFYLRKWSSNVQDALKGIPDEDIESTSHMNFKFDHVVKTLGISWNRDQDTFTYSFQPVPFRQHITKRIILSDVSSVFDPLGLCVPIITQGKLLIQRIWNLHSDWDEPLTDQDILNEFYTVRFNLNYLLNIKIPRCVTIQNSEITEIHGFCDASENAYAATIYIRCKSNEIISSHLLCAKTKLAPSKSMLSIPKLELCGAWLLAQLSTEAASALNISHITLWTDSTIVLNWLQRLPRELITFVGNRVADIQRLTTNSIWKHIPTKLNPADIATRPITAPELQENMLWWHGPSFLQQPKTSWPTPKLAVLNDLPGMKTCKNKANLNCTLITTPAKVLDSNTPPFDPFFTSSHRKLIRSIAYVRRYFHKLRFSQTLITGPLSASELKESLHALIRFVQKYNFRDEYLALSNKKPLPKSSRLKSLCPILDSENIIRVGGRLSNALIPYDQRHQIILPSKHPFTTNLIHYIHQEYYHAGVQFVHNQIRQHYWIIHGKSTIKKLIKGCIKCAKLNLRPKPQLMGQLPRYRITPSPPFTHTGVDFAGPFTIKMHNNRSRTVLKVYISVFICMTVKAVHLEIVSDLTSDAFIAALTRFASRRGKPSIMYSDNGTNFIGADRKLREIIESESVINYSADESIEWKFNPPSSPHFGGLWEAAVKSFKNLLRKAIGNATLRYEELLTITIKVEAILNSRPLYALSDDPNDLSPLTPGHFLIGRALTSIPEPTIFDPRTNYRNRWEIVNRINQSFWKTWSKDYLHNLQQRLKWQQPSHNFQPNDLVLVKPDHSLKSSYKWILGRILDVHPGDDKCVRVVTIKTPHGIYKRPAANLAYLPTSHE